MSKTNPRQGKTPYTLWLEPEEEKGLMEIIENESYFRRVGELMKKLHKRGDFVKR